MLEIEGVLDLRRTGSLRAELLGAIHQQARCVVLQIAEVCPMDSGGMAALLALVSKVRSRNVEVAVVIADPSLRRILHLTGVDRQITICRDHAEALQRLSGS